MPVVQLDFCFFKTAGEATTAAILAGIDCGNRHGMVMATMVGDKQRDFQYHANCIQSFLMECGRVQAVLNSTILQSDQEDHSDSTTTNSSKQNGRQHHRQAITDIQLASTRQRRTAPSNIDGTNQNTESPITTKLRQNNHQQTPNSTMAGTAHSVLAQHVRNTCGRQHKLFPQMEQRPQTSNLWVSRNNAILTSNLQTTRKDGTTFLQSNLAWKRHVNRRNTPGHWQQGC